ncbi:dihydropteroate synthase [Olsenella sp. HMSC062G07]|uniref:dihydropteroate synthase n=1 Tax=Olsenella sp. HMSC062G07 TaxID=1739330 RepID=UPI0008A11A66|nr:dihydropteroate synthase [Olsenella sp. HMSC062G07]OFK25314.1 dihydropteroate synthase [Olsenella sp. HMSC062G07]
MLREDYATWRCGRHELSLTRPRVMGVLNVTPDSFSDGGQNADARAAIDRALQMLDEGADIIDVGGESTRPGHTPVDPEEEGNRIVPVVRGILAAAPSAIVSIDTRHAAVAKIAVRLGASIVNDVSGFTDPAMVEVAAESRCGCIVMHWNRLSGVSTRRSVTLDSPRLLSRRPAQPRVVPTSTRRFTLPEEAPIMREIMGFLGDQARTLMRADVSHDRICIDPGPGFDKTADEDVVVQRATHKLVSMGYPVVTAVSRKRFVGAVSGVADAARRDAATIGMVLSAIEAGSRIVRVHDVASTTQAVNGYWSVAKPDARQGFVSLGSNVGDRVDNLTRAVKLINKIPLTRVVLVSRAYETEPAYGIDTPVANAVAEIRTELHPLVLLDALMGVEEELQRVRDPRQAGHGPRTIDCDLAFVEGERHAGPKLTLPHPHLGERDYVLVPMEDLMHDPVRFLMHAGVPVFAPEERVGHVLSELGELDWQEA